MGSANKNKGSHRQERRLLPRWNISSKALIKWEGQNDYLPCRIIDINLKGFYVSLAANLPGRPVNFTISFYERYIINAQAVPVWHEQKKSEHRYKMKITRIRDTDKEKIYQMVRQDFFEQFGNQFK